MVRFRAILTLTRPVFLAGGVLVNALGIAIAYSQGYSVNLGHALLSQSLVTTIQLFAQYTNEYYDIEVDRIGSNYRTWFSGGSGILPSGRVSTYFVLRWMRIFLVVGIILLLIAATQTRPFEILTIGAFSILGSWFYSAPPLSLKGSGLGEMAASVVVTFFVPLTAYLLQTGRFDLTVIVICSPLFLIHWSMLIAFSFPDLQADSTTGKRTLAVRVGLRGAAAFSILLIVASFPLAIWLIRNTLQVNQIDLVLFATPLAAFQVFNLINSPSGWRTHLNALTTAAVSLFVLFTLLWLLTLVSLRLPFYRP